MPNNDYPVNIIRRNFVVKCFFEIFYGSKPGFFPHKYRSIPVRTGSIRWHSTLTSAGPGSSIFVIVLGKQVLAAILVPKSVLHSLLLKERTPSTRTAQVDFYQLILGYLPKSGT